MDFLAWLNELGIHYYLSENIGGYIFGLKEVTLSNGLMSVKNPCMLGRSPKNSISLFIISYNGFVFSKGGYIINADKFTVENSPQINIDKINKK